MNKDSEYSGKEGQDCHPAPDKESACEVMTQCGLQPVVRRAAVLEFKESAGVRQSEVARGNSRVEIGGGAARDGDGPVWILCHKWSAIRNVHVCTDGSGNDEESISGRPRGCWRNNQPTAPAAVKAHRRGEPLPSSARILTE
jgi:hypothetical protein